MQISQVTSVYISSNVMKDKEEAVLPEGHKTAQRRQIGHKKNLLGKYCYCGNSKEDLVDIKESALENTNTFVNMLKNPRNKMENILK